MQPRDYLVAGQADSTADALPRRTCSDSRSFLLPKCKKPIFKPEPVGNALVKSVSFSGPSRRPTPKRIFKVLKQTEHRLADYSHLRSLYEQDGVTQSQVVMLRAFSFTINQAYRRHADSNGLAGGSQNESQVLKTICLFSQILLFRDSEVLYWAGLNGKGQVEAFLEESDSKDLSSSCSPSYRHKVLLQALTQRLLMTGYFTKIRLSSKRVGAATEEFFSKYFGEFGRKFQGWRSSCEPLEPSPIDLNSLRARLLKLGRSFLYTPECLLTEEQNQRRFDLNQIVASLTDESPEQKQFKVGRRKKSPNERFFLLGKRPRPDHPSSKDQTLDTPDKNSAFSDGDRNCSQAFPVAVEASRSPPIELADLIPESAKPLFSPMKAPGEETGLFSVLQMKWGTSSPPPYKVEVCEPIETNLFLESIDQEILNRYPPQQAYELNIQDQLKKSESIMDPRLSGNGLDPYSPAIEPKENFFLLPHSSMTLQPDQSEEAFRSIENELSMCCQPESGFRS